MIKKARPNIKNNSLHAYLISLRKMNKDKEIKSLDYLTDYDDIITFLKKFRLPTKRNYITAILVALKACDNDDYAEAAEEYRLHLAELNSEYNKIIESHKKSKTQTENWVTTADQKKGLKLLRKDIRDREMLEKDTLNKKEMDLLQQYLVVALFTLHPPTRLDYGDMEVIRCKKDMKEDKNYLLITGRNKKQFIIQNHKTAKFHGALEKRVEPELNSIINIWLKYNKSSHFLIDSKGDGMNQNQLSKYISKSFSFTGKNMTLNLLRHVVDTERICGTGSTAQQSQRLEEHKKNKQLARDMMHSVKMQLDYCKI